MSFDEMRALERAGKTVRRFRGKINECDTQVSAFEHEGVYWLLIHRRASGLAMGRNSFGFGRYNVPLVDNQFKSFPTKEEANAYFMKYLSFCKRVEHFDVWRIGNAGVEIG